MGLGKLISDNQKLLLQSMADNNSILSSQARNAIAVIPRT